MASRKALIVWGGWDGHEPEQVANFFNEILQAEGFETEISNTLDSFCEEGKLNDLSLIVPIWTMGEISPEQRNPVLKAVGEHGVGMAGCHGGMCDAFRADTEWQFLTGGQWVAHPGNDGVRYAINMRSKPHPIIDAIGDFEVSSEQYYLHVDPGVDVLATCDFPAAGVEGPHTGNPCKMPQVWTKMYGKGRIYYNALGHQRNVLEAKEPRELIRRGCLWAAKGVGLINTIVV
ncbi:MAG: ThuA domain-containing protein [Fimbriimonas sp.]